jgi:peptidylprolyl isomerase
MRRRPTALLAATAAVLSLGLLATACGDDSEDTAADDTTSTSTTTTVDISDLPACEEVYQADPAATAGPEAVEDRGAPTMEACNPEVSDLVVIDEVTGTGAEVAPSGTVTAHYSGISAATGEEFDSSWSRGEPATFPLDRVIPGWTDGLVGMKEGGRRTLVIPADLAYGSNPPPGSGIAPGATLVFTVDLVSTP